MLERIHILNAVYNAVQTTNEALPCEIRLKTNESELLFGEGAKIDSLAFVTLMVAVEQEIEKLAGSSPSLVSELSDPSAGVSTLGNLVDYISLST